jgi:hypothetical protein
MGIGVIILVCIVVITITALIALLTKDRKDNPHQTTRNQTTRRFYIRPPLMGTTDPHKSGFWYTTNWFAGEKVNEAVSEGKARYAHQRSSHHAHSQQKRSRHGR